MTHTPTPVPWRSLLMGLVMVAGCEITGEFQEDLPPDTLIGICVDFRDKQTWTIRRKDVTKIGVDSIGAFLEIEVNPGVPLRIHPGDNRSFIKCSKEPTP